MTSLQPYTAYRPSGIDWLGNVPTHWEVVPLKRRAATGAGAGFPHEFQGHSGGEIPFYKVNSLAKASRDGAIDFVDEAVSRETALSLRAKIYPAGSVVLAKIGAALLLGRIRTLGVDACIDNNMMSVQASGGTNARFLYYALTLIRFDLLVNPGAVPSTSEGTVAEWKLAFPAQDEQHRIAEFLDRETAQIDDLIVKQERLIELLGEKRQAIITHAVTKGLDPNAPTKPSGIPWLGDVPSHWKLGPVKHFYHVVLGKMLQREKEMETDTLRSYLKAANVKSGKIALSDSNHMWFSRDEIDSLSLRSGDVLVVEGGSIGQSALVEDDLPDTGFEKSLNRVRPKPGSSSKYFQLYMTMARESGYVAMQCVGATFMHLTAEKLGRMIMPVPPLSEQLHIALETEKRLRRLDNASAKSRDLVDALRERRAALISAAVTGKINVQQQTVTA